MTQRVRWSLWSVRWFGLAQMEQPSGTDKFLFSDFEGSTPLWDQHHDGMQAATARHDAILQGVIDARGGMSSRPPNNVAVANASRERIPDRYVGLLDIATTRIRGGPEASVYGYGSGRTGRCRAHLIPMSI